VSSPAFPVLSERVVSSKTGPPGAIIGLQPAASSAKIDSCEANPRNDPRCPSFVNGNLLTFHKIPDTHTQRLEREEKTRHGQTAPEIHPPTGQASVEIGGEGDGGDWRSLGPQRGRVAPPRHEAAHNGEGTHRPLPADLVRIDMALVEAGAREAARLIRSARLRDLLAAIEEYRRASGSDRAWWRSQAGHLIRQWRRRYPHYWEAAA